jgi:hypothetical protein
MDRIDEILEKYFRAETSIDEEQELKAYFGSGKVKPAHEQYKPLFLFYETERKEKFTGKLPEFTEKSVKYKQNIYLRSISIGISIAAVLLIAIMLIKPQYNTPRDYAMVNGKYIDNEEIVMQMVNSKLENINGVLSRTMKPVESISKVRNSLEPVRKISETISSNE